MHQHRSSLSFPHGAGSERPKQIEPGALCCSFCGFGEGEVARLFEGRQKDYICDECIEVCEQLLSDYRELGVPPPSIEVVRVPWFRRLLWRERMKPIHCTFCNYPVAEGQRLLAGPHTQICERCVRACANISTGKGLVLPP